MGYGATQEIGPFLVDNKGNSLQFNPYAWNHGIPNFLYIKSSLSIHIITMYIPYIYIVSSLGAWSFGNG